MTVRVAVGSSFCSSYHSARRSRLSRPICLLVQPQSGGSGTPCFFVRDSPEPVAGSAFFLLHRSTRHSRSPRRIPHLRSQGASRDGKPCFPCSERAVLVSGDRTVSQESVRRSPVSVRAAGRASPCRRFPFLQIFCFRIDSAMSENDIDSLKTALPIGATRIFKYLAFSERPSRRTGPDIQCQR